MNKYTHRAGHWAKLFEVDIFRALHSRLQYVPQQGKSHPSGNTV